MSRRSGRAKSVVAENNTTLETGNSPEIDESSEITRCICRNDELSTTNPDLEQLLVTRYGIKIDNGLFIQCEKCSVWQHGYCVGLFVDQDVPDKYWCEMCKPAFHLFVTNSKDNLERTLYKAVNKERQLLLDFSLDTAKLASTDLAEKNDVKAERPDKGTRSRNRRSPAGIGGDKATVPKDSSQASASNPASRQTRKERRHGQDVFDEQLQRALRESASSNNKKRPRETEAISSRGSGKRTQSEDSVNDVRDSGPEEESEAKEGKHDQRAKGKPRGKQKSRVSRAQSPKTEEDRSNITKEELLRQPSMPRFVSEKATIYELRKRTGAILEWLGRSQMEIEEERDIKTSQFKEANVEAAGLLLSVEENSKLMANLTEKILTWERRFGKYAP